MTSSNGQVWSSFECNEVIIPREQWLSALKNSGYRQTVLFEVPLPTVSDQLMTVIAKAQEFIETGHYKDAVMQCRRIIEQIETLRNDKQQSIDASKKTTNRQERENMSAIERMVCLREQMKNVCHLGAHGSEDFTRSQAKAILA